MLYSYTLDLKAPGRSRIASPYTGSADKSFFLNPAIKTYLGPSLGDMISLTEEDHIWNFPILIVIKITAHFIPNISCIKSDLNILTKNLF